MTVFNWELIEVFCARQGMRATKAFDQWLQKVERMQWKTFQDIRQTFANHADPYKGESGAAYVIFDVGGNKYRLVARVYYEDERVVVVNVMTHDVYDRQHWKEGL